MFKRIASACINPGEEKLMSSVKLVSFDVWDTLLSVRSYYQSIALELAKSVNLAPETIADKLVEGYRKVRAIRRAGGFSDSEIVPSALEAIANFLDVDSGTVSRAILAAIESHPSEQHLMEGAKEAVRRVKELGLKVVVVGNVVFWPGSYNRILLEKAGLAMFIDEQFYADELGVSKPKPEIFAKMLSRFNVQPHEALHVGDGVFEDLVGAVLSHMNAVLIDENVDGVVKLSSWKVYIIPRIGLLEQVVRELEKH
ncbi:MAG: HAD family hydrolase [Candidatus Bathyarchaeia archaeon]